MKLRTGSRTLLEAKHLQVMLPTGRGPLMAVDDVSLSLSPGATLGIVGESGCGKTMLAKALMGLLPSDATVAADSRVRFHGRDLTRLTKARRRRIIGREMAMIFQDHMNSINQVMKVGQQVAEVLHWHMKLGRTAARLRAVALLDRVGIPMAARRAEQYPFQLSGGLRQRVAIAIALACEPQLLIADEPTTALDVTVQAAVLDLLKALQRQKRMAMILITHDLGVVAGHTDEAAVMYAGKIVEYAPTGTLFRQMRMPYTHALMAAIPRLSNRPHTRLKAIDGRPPDMVDPPPGCRFAPRCWKRQPRCLENEPRLERIDARGHRLACWYPLESAATFDKRSNALRP